MVRSSFAKAKPVWLEGYEKEMNLTAGFRAVFHKPEEGSVWFRIAASTLYRFYVNGRFAGHGPARGPHGYYRLDEWDITGWLAEGVNILAIEVTGYNTNSYYVLDQPSFIQAEIVRDHDVLAHTSANGMEFQAGLLKERLQKVQRYSFQRPFLEAYRLKEDYDAWRNDSSVELGSMKCVETEVKSLLPRQVPYPGFDERLPASIINAGKVIQGGCPEVMWTDRTLEKIGEKLKGFGEQELELHLSEELQKLSFKAGSITHQALNPDQLLQLNENSDFLFDFGVNTSGFAGFEFRCSSTARIMLLFDEVLTDGDIDFKRLECINAVSIQFQPGYYRFETFEPYTMRYLKLLITEGSGTIERVYIREYVNPDVSQAEFQCSSEKLNRIYEAGRETFRQNAVDIYMDCPSRERAGWLCDSFFTARVEFSLTGGSAIERSFLENFLLPSGFAHLPKGMLPMCYPADHPDGNFIPNWALWLVLELEEYGMRTGDMELVLAFKDKVYDLFSYLKGFRNEDGLLEKLDGWIFVEWSRANDFVQDVNYPTNMLYAAALACAGRIFEDSVLLAEAESIRSIIRWQAFNGEFFVDNAVRIGDELRRTENISEVCQYFAFYFDLVTPKTHPRLWNLLVSQFGPDRNTIEVFPFVHPANAFIGNYLRLELLARYGFESDVLKQMEKFFFYMAEKTGTLWEHQGEYASCNHGFASHVVFCLYRDALGISKLDKTNKTVEITFTENGLDQCKGKMMVDGQAVSVEWRREEALILYKIDVPEHYSLQIKNRSRYSPVSLRERGKALASRHKES